MNNFFSLLAIILFCLDYIFVYKKTIKENPNLSEKQRAHILSIKASITIFLLSCFFNYKFLNKNLDIQKYNQSISENDLFLLNLGVLQLVSYFLCDIINGFLNYHKYMCTLAGYTHHIFYIFISLISMKYNLQSLYFLYMIEELPTIFLSSGHYSKLFRNDNLFGLTFFITRICYHTYLTYKVRDNYLFLALGIMTLGLHSYWFKNWFTKYFLKTNFFTKKVLPKNKNE